MSKPEGANIALAKAKKRIVELEAKLKAAQEVVGAAMAWDMTEYHEGLYADRTQREIALKTALRRYEANTPEQPKE